MFVSPGESPLSRPANERARENNFTALRLVLATLVMVQHAPELADGDRRRELLTLAFHTIGFGDLAVDAFFILSGFLIVQSWERQPQVFDFLKKRILRIYPGFIVASLLCAFLVGPLASAPVPYFSAFDFLAFVRSVVLLQPLAIPPVFHGQPYALVNGSVWTISYEFLCYLLVAFSGGLSLFRLRVVWLILTVIAILLFALIVGLPNPSRYFPASLGLFGNTMYTLRFLAFFGAGGCFFLYRERIRYHDGMAVMALVITLLALFRFGTAALVLPIFGAYCFLWLAFKPLSLLRRAVFSSDISYGVYLYGWPVQKLVHWWWPSLSPWGALLVAVPCAYLCGILSWHLVERPALKWKYTH